MASTVVQSRTTLLTESGNRGEINSNSCVVAFCSAFCDLQALMEIQTEFGIPTTADFGDNRIGTQFSIGKAYHSRCHADPDYFYTLLSVFWAEAQPTDVICWFIFPRYKVKVPLRNGDFLVFDPKEPHSCTNMIHEDALIFSQYTSEKTYHAHISSQCK